MPNTTPRTQSRRFRVILPVTIRTCTEEDLPALEWFGMFTPHREIIRSAFERQRRGGNLMLIADVNDFPAGQIWIDLEKKRDESTGVFWALRVFPFLQRLGLGARLMKAAETALRRRGFDYAELGVEHGAEAAGFYERLGYRPAGTLREEFSYTTPAGVPVRATADQVIYRKPLRGREAK